MKAILFLAFMANFACNSDIKYCDSDFLSHVNNENAFISYKNNNINHNDTNYCATNVQIKYWSEIPISSIYYTDILINETFFCKDDNLLCHNLSSSQHLLSFKENNNEVQVLILKKITKNTRNDNILISYDTIKCKVEDRFYEESVSDFIYKFILMNIDRVIPNSDLVLYFTKKVGFIGLYICRARFYLDDRNMDEELIYEKYGPIFSNRYKNIIFEYNKGIE